MMPEETPDSSVGSAGLLKFDTVIIRYGGEIGIKGGWTRRAYETRLRRNIKEALRRNLIEYDELKRRPGRLYLKA
ncbi:MAG: tRNA sulfurtransferase, partial [Candidatus Bathyarchaeota archaeon B26-1]